MRFRASVFVVCAIPIFANGAEPVAEKPAGEIQALEEIYRQLQEAEKKEDKAQQELLHAKAAGVAEQWYDRIRKDKESAPATIEIARQNLVDYRKAWGKFLRDGQQFAKAAEVYAELDKLITRDVDAWDWRAVDARHAAQEAIRTSKYTILDSINLATLFASVGDAYGSVRQGKYAEGVKKLEQATESMRKLCGDDSAEYFELLIALAGLHKEAGHYAEAEAAFERLIKRAEEIFGKRHPKYAEVQNLYGALRFSQNRFREAVVIFRRCLEIYGATLGEESSDYSLVLNNLAASLRNLEEFQEVEPLLLKALEIQRRTMGERHPRCALALNNLGSLYQVQGRFAESEKAFIDSLEIYEEANGKQHPDTLDSAEMLADLYQEQGKYAAAEPIYFRVRDGRKEALGEKHPDYGDILTSIGFLHRTQGAFAEAEPYLKEAVEIARHNFGENNARYANAVNNLGSLYWSQGDYERAAAFFRQALAIFEKIGDEDTWYAQSLANLGASYNEMGRYQEGEPVLRRSAEIYERKLGPKHPQLALALGNLSFAVGGLGDVTERDKLDRRVVEIYREAYGEKHIDYARALGNMACNYFNRDDLERAETTFQQALAAYRAAVGEEHPEYALYLENLASVYGRQNRLKEAERTLRRAQEIQLAKLGETHSQYINGLSDYGNILYLQQRLDEAQAVYDRGLALTEKNGVNSAEAGTLFYHGLAVVAHARGDDVGAERSARRAVEESAAWVDAVLGSQSERRQLALTAINRRYFGTYITVAVDSGKFAEQAYQFAFRQKGTSWMQQRRLRAVADDPQAAPLFAELQATASKLAQQAMNAPKPELREVWLKEVEALTRQKESLETKLAASSAAFSKARQAVTPDDLRAALPADAALVDFIEYRHANKPSAAGADGIFEQRLAAFVVRPGKPVELIDLTAAKTTTEVVERWRETHGIGPDGVAAGKQLRAQLWEPLETRLAGAKLVLISPDGALGRFPFAALPGRNPDDYLIEDWSLAVIPVPQALPELLKTEETPVPENVQNMLLVGGIDYDADQAVAAAPKKSLGRRVLRGADWKAFTPLDGTVGEIAVIEKTYRELIDERGLTTLEKGAAVEERIIAEAPRHLFLHIATHGFFAPPSLRSTIASSTEVAATPSGDRSHGGAPSAVDLHPGLLSGLALSGANQPVSGDRADGILTAEEVQTLDLRRVRMAVLSACETGLGEIAGGEGLLGLQRAFQVAGARTTVTSLWKVDDVQTRALMERFYRNLWDKEMSRAEALREAQLWMLREGPRRDVRIRPADGQPEPELKKSPPFYWAAFILSGDWRPVIQSADK